MFLVKSPLFLSVLPSAEEKPAYVRRMFDTIAARYDRVNRLMTFGLDQGWRRYAVREVMPGISPLNDFPVALDIGSGTGDFLPILRRLIPGVLAIGLDFSLPMMQAGRHNMDARSSFVGGDALCLPFEDNSIDVVTTGFAMRNVSDLLQAFREIRRVVRPGGRLVCLEVARPANSVLRWGHQVYFNHIVPHIGSLVGGNREAYQYLPQSAGVFPQPDVLCDLLIDAGWHDPIYRLLGLGAVAVHRAEK